MRSLLFLSVFDGSLYLGEEGQSFGVAAIIALIAILIVFVILAIIICAIKLMEIIYKKAAKKKEVPVTDEVSEKVEEVKNTNIEDDDMMAAVLVATIDYANETKKDVRLKSVKRIG